MAVTEVSNADIWAKLQKMERDIASANEQLTLDGATLANISATLTASTASQTALGALTPETVTPWGSNSLGPILAALGCSAPAQTAWVSSTQAIFHAFNVTESVTVYKLFWVNGAVTSGNVDCGIYDSSLTRLVSSGSTAQSGTVQVVNTADTVLTSGTYYIGLVMDNTTGTGFKTSLGNFPNLAAGAPTATITFPLPATVTFDGVSNTGNVWVCGAALRSDFA